ncbi:hypothetical protein [Nocardia noduli]|uniref:hypothetical protein n=1 Tax=Nocardia noduli TaxID=2815722 RepID=UPI001C247DF3|nr:hypothetical protein [Nocardia noduli]
MSSIIPSAGVIAGTVGLAGAVLLLLGRAAGRWLVVAASVVELAFFGLWAAAGSYLPILPIGVVATTFAFAVCGPTTRWLEAAKQARRSAA